MEFIIISGLSGAGKTSALHVLEDIGYYCVDNIPASLLSTLYTLCLNSTNEAMKRAAVVVDVRGNDNYEQMNNQIEDFKKSHSDVKILFIDARSDIVIMRYKETRRKHPLSDRLRDGTVTEAVEFEKALLTPVKRAADYHINTTHMSKKQMRERVISLFMEDVTKSLTLTFMSFGFKFGIPLEADIVFDVRCLPNPFYIPELKMLTGLDSSVRNYVLCSNDTQQFLKRTLDLLDFSVPLYYKEGKSELVVGVGCTGGKHRSVTVARALQEHFQSLGYKSVVSHRDIEKPTTD